MKIDQRKLNHFETICAMSSIKNSVEWVEAYFYQFCVLLWDYLVVYKDIDWLVSACMVTYDIQTDFWLFLRYKETNKKEIHFSNIK